MKLLSGLLLGLLIGSVTTVGANDWQMLEYQRQQAAALQQLQWQQNQALVEQQRQRLNQQWNQAIGKSPC